MKLDVFGIVGAALHFVAANFVSVFRIGWLPVAVFLAVDGLTRKIAMATSSSVLPFELGYVTTLEDTVYVGTFWWANLIFILVSATIMIAYLRTIIERENRGDALAYFWFGHAELRYVAASVILLGVSAVVVVAAYLARAAQLVPWETGFYAFFVLLAALVWVWLRLSLQSAVILRERGLGFIRAWALLRGNTFRLALALAIAVVPVWVLGMYGYLAVPGPDWPPLPEWQGDTIQNWPRKWFEWYFQVIERMEAYPVEMSAIDFTTKILEYALTAGVIGKAYVQLTATDGR